MSGFPFLLLNSSESCNFPVTKDEVKDSMPEMTACMKSKGIESSVLGKNNCQEN